MKTPLQPFFVFLALSSIVLFTNNFAQTAPLQYYIQSYQLESGVFDGDKTLENKPVEVFSSVVELHSVPWMQLHFSDSHLGDGSYIIIKSLYDDLWQKLDAISLEQWNNYSAFFNGNAIEIKLFLAPTDQQVFINIDKIIVGEWYQEDPSFSICGPTDDRIASNQPATARLLSVGCTTWIIPNGKFATAGHCLDGSSSTVVEFNVPLSLPNGTLQHPGPEDQYSVNVSTKIFTNGGIGNDWGVFEVYPNSITGLMPKQAQNAYWPLVQDLGPDSIRITGYGVDSGTANQTQQTHVGPNAGSSGTTMRYRTDTEGGNSGSPVIDALTNTAVGVHTHGGCTSSGGNNSGTSTFHTAFWAAVDEGNVPVELSSFNASVVDGVVELSWITATETNNQGFEIQKSYGGDFESVDFVDGNGTTTEPNAYSYSDKNLSVGTCVYRLKQIDFDGTFSYSKTIEVEIASPSSFALEQNFPNPFNPSTVINYQLPFGNNVTLKVYDILGNEVAVLVDEYKPAGEYEVEFGVSSGISELVSGIYFYQLRAGDFIQTKKMLLVK
jgi:V8-like Glu-specific endopeptidase